MTRPRRRSILIGAFLVLVPALAWAGQALLVQGMEAQKAGRNQQALELLNKYLEAHPQMVEARYYRALALGRPGSRQ